MTRQGILAASLLAVSALSVSSAFAADEVNVVRGQTTAGAPLALHGYDPVSYFTNGKAVRANGKISTAYNGAAYYFESEEHLKLFKADPAHYAPQYGGFCAYGASVGKKFDGDPELWTIQSDKLYVNLNPDIVEKFKKDVPGNIKKADSNWTKIEHKAVGDL